MAGNTQKWFLLLINLITFSVQASADFMDDLLAPPTYDNKVRPGLNSGQPVVVDIDMFINSISSVDEVKMEYSLSIFLRQRWHDDRLQFNHTEEDITLNYNVFEKLWVPDLFINNEKDANFHIITVPNRLLRVSPNGKVYYSQRLSLTLKCDMYLRKYPMDNQSCPIGLESYGYTTKDIVFQWRGDVDAVQIKDPLELPEFNIEGTSIGSCTQEYITGSFTCVYANIYLKRQFEFYLIQTFIPSIMIVALSWVSFWIDRRAVPARVTLGLLTVLTMTTQSSGISSRLPRVSYIKAIDIWMTVCLVFVFGALIEYSIVNVISRKENTDTTKERDPEGDTAPENTESRLVKNGSTNGTVEKPHVSVVDIQERTAAIAAPSDITIDDEEEKTIRQVVTGIVQIDEKSVVSLEKDRKLSLLRRMKKTPAYALDMVSRIFFPASFIVFNVIYWLLYMGE